MAGLLSITEPTATEPTANDTTTPAADFFANAPVVTETTAPIQRSREQIAELFELH